MSHFLDSIGMTSGMFTSACITILLCVVAIIAGRNLKMLPSGFQNVAELAIEKLYGFFEGIMGEKNCKKYFGIVATLYIYILFCNYSGLLPASGHLPGLAAPTSSVNCTLCLALFVFVAFQVVGVKSNRGLKYYKHWFKPFAFLFPLMILEDLVKPVSLTLRLYGNIFGEEAVGTSFFNLCPIGLPVIMQFLSVLMGLIQALVFSLLASLYIAEATEPIEEHL